MFTHHWKNLTRTALKLMKYNFILYLINYKGVPETYYRRSIFIPFLDHLLDQLKFRFLNHRELLSKIQNILPTKCCELTTEEVVVTAKTFRK
jgi:hypothetical protein